MAVEHQGVEDRPGVAWTMGVTSRIRLLMVGLEL